MQQHVKWGYVPTSYGCCEDYELIQGKALPTVPVYSDHKCQLLTHFCLNMYKPKSGRIPNQIITTTE